MPEFQVMLQVDPDVVRKDAELLADAGHHGSAHLLYKALEALEHGTPEVKAALGWPVEDAGEFTLGDKVTFDSTLSRGWEAPSRKVWKQTGRRGQGVVIGKRTYANGRVEHYGYDGGPEFTPTEHFPVYLVVTGLRRAPVAVTPEHLRPAGGDRG